MDRIVILNSDGKIVKNKTVTLKVLLLDLYIPIPVLKEVDIESLNQGIVDFNIIVEDTLTEMNKRITKRLIKLIMELA